MGLLARYLILLLTYGVLKCTLIYGNSFHPLTSELHSSHPELSPHDTSGSEHKDLTSPVVEIERSGPTKVNEGVTLTGLEETGEWAKEVVPEILKNLPVDPLNDKNDDDIHSNGNGNGSISHDLVAGIMDEFHEKEEPSHDLPENKFEGQEEQNDGFGPFSNEMKSSPEEENEYDWLEEPVQESVRPVEESMVPGIQQLETPPKDQVLSQVETGLVYLMKTAHHSGITVHDIMDHLRNRLQTETDKQRRNTREPQDKSVGVMM